MKKETKLLSVFLISLFFVSLFTGIVAAQESTVIDKFKEILTNAFGGTTTYDYVGNILSPQILFAVLIFLIIFAIIGRISIFQNRPWLSIGTSLVVGILAAAFIKGDWLKPILNQYTALGVAISFLIPFVLLFYFLKEIAPHNRIVQGFVWAVYLIIVLFNIIINWDSTKDSPMTRFLYVIIFILTLCMLLFSKVIFKWLFKEQLGEAIDKYKQVQDLIAAGDQAKARAALYSVGTQLPEGEKNKLEAEIRKMGPSETIK